MNHQAPDRSNMSLAVTPVNSEHDSQSSQMDVGYIAYLNTDGGALAFNSIFVVAYRLPTRL